MKQSRLVGEFPQQFCAARTDLFAVGLLDRTESAHGGSQTRELDGVGVVIGRQAFKNCFERAFVVRLLLPVEPPVFDCRMWRCRCEHKARYPSSEQRRSRATW